MTAMHAEGVEQVRYLLKAMHSGGKKTDSKTDAEAKQKSEQLTRQSRQQAQATVKSTQTPITPQQQKQQVLPKAFTDTAQSNAATRPLPSSTAASLAAQNAVRARSIAQCVFR